MLLLKKFRGVGVTGDNNWKGEIVVVRREYDEKLMEISRLISQMGEQTTEFVAGVMQALVAFDGESAKSVRHYENEVDDLYRRIDERCVALIATQQPAAGDLRFLIASIKISAEIERIADYANNIAKIIHKKLPRLDINCVAHLSTAIKDMGDLAVGMLADSVQAYANKDSIFVDAVKRRDKDVNQANLNIFKQMIETGAKDINAQTAILELHTVVRYIERVADRSVNIAEWVFYMETGFRYVER